jgi:hypothetical protein
VLLGQCSFKEGLRATWQLFKQYPVSTMFIASTSFVLTQVYGIFAFLPAGWLSVIGNIIGLLMLIFGTLLQFNFLLQRTGAYPPSSASEAAAGRLIDTHA